MINTTIATNPLFFFVLPVGGKCPFAQLPLLEVDNTLLAQSKAILRYVGIQHGE